MEEIPKYLEIFPGISIPHEHERIFCRLDPVMDLEDAVDFANLILPNSPNPPHPTVEFDGDVAIRRGLPSRYFATFEYGGNVFKIISIVDQNHRVEKIVYQIILNNIRENNFRNCVDEEHSELPARDSDVDLFDELDFGEWVFIHYVRIPEYF